MPDGLPPGMIDGARAQFTDEINEHRLVELTKVPNLRVMQHSMPVTADTYRLLNDVVFSVRPDVQLRVYAHYSTPCVLGFAPLMTNVRNFSADCLMQASNVDAVTEMEHLDALSIGILSLDNFDFLSRVTTTITSLSLSQTKSKKPKLSYLKRFPALKALYLEAQQNDIDVLGGLTKLEDLTLRSVSLPDLKCLSPLQSLRSLDLKLGGIRSFQGIEGKSEIRYLELWQIRDVRSAEVIATLPGLQNVFLQSLPHVEDFPRLTSAVALRRVVVENMKGLRDFSALADAPALDEFALLDGKSQVPNQLEPLLRNPKPRFVIGYFGSTKKNEEFDRLRQQHNKLEWTWSTPFQYR